MPAYERTIHKLCQSDFTRHKAKCLYSVASQRTGKNTGHDLGKAHGALAEICAFLASETTGMGDVNQEQARASACLDVKTFDSALQIVKRVVTNSSPAVGFKRVTFGSLVCQFEVREDAEVAMMEVEQTLKQSNALSNAQLGVDSPVVQCAIFHWVCTKIFELSVPDFSAYQEKYKLSQKAWFLAHRLLDRHCTRMVENLAACAKTAAMSTRTRSQTRKQTQQSVLALSNNNGHPLDNVLPHRPGVVKAMKGKVRKEPIDVKEFETPPKRHKGATYMPSPLGQDWRTHTRKTVRGNAAVASGRKNTRQVASCWQDDSEEDSIGTIVVQPRHKSPRHADSTAWEAQPPEPPDIDSTPTKPTSKNINSIFTTSTNTMNSTPMTSTGTFSDSPSSTRSSHPTLPERFRSLAPAAESSSWEEMPRVRRRNRRASFLDPSVYSWNPSPRIRERLDAARRFEALIISKCGDPWADL